MKEVIIMVKIIEPGEVSREDIEREVLQVFEESVRILGGIRGLARYRNLTWLPSLISAAYVIVLSEHGFSKDDIAKELGLSENTIRNILRADELAVLAKITGEADEEKRYHIAGGIAKFAYKKLKGLVKDPEDLSRAIFYEVLEMLGGLRNLVEYRNLTWITSLARASIVVALSKLGYPRHKIAETLGIEESTVDTILEADVNVAKERLEAIKKGSVEEGERTHLAGALAKMAAEKLGI